MSSAFPVTGGAGAMPIDPRWGATGYVDETAEEADARRAQEVDAGVKYWLSEVAAQLEVESEFRKEADGAWNRYFGESDKSFTASKSDGSSNLAHSIIETLKPIFYSERPDPIVRRRFGGDGKKDPADKFVAEVAQRAAQYIIDTTDFHISMEAARDDWLVSGRGSARVGYAAEIENGEVRSESAEVYYWPWRDTLFGSCAAWSRCPWVAYRHYWDREEATEKVGKEIAEQMNYALPGRSASDTDAKDDADWGASDGKKPEPVNAHTKARAEVWEVWWKKKRQVIWVSSGYMQGYLKLEADPLNLVGFFDCARPLLASTKGQTLIPRPDMAYYANQIDAIDKAGKKLDGILNDLKVIGFYPGSEDATLKRGWDASSGKMIAVPNWLALQEKGGINNIVQWLPINQFVEAATALAGLLEQRKMMLYEASGVSDAMRGAADPNRTATGEKIQGRYAGLRTSAKQQRMAHFALDIITMSVEIAAELFSDETLAAMTQIDLPWTEQERQMRSAVVQDPATGQPVKVDPAFEDKGTSWEAVRGKLRDDLQRAYTVSIETDSTILEDETEDRQGRIEFLTTFANFVQTLLPLVQGLPEMLPLVKGLLLFTVRGFRKARMLEHMIDALPDEAPPAQPEKPSDAQIRADTDLKLEQIKAAVEKELQAEKLKHESNEGAKDRAHEKSLKGIDVQVDAATLQAKAELDDRKDAAKHEREEAKAGRDDARKDIERREGAEREDQLRSEERTEGVKDRLTQAVMRGMGAPA